MPIDSRSLNHLYDSLAPFLERVATIAASASALIVTYIFVFQHKLNVSFFPINGVFQTFNPLRRICTGEVLGEDFNPYLGLGTTGATALITSLIGCNLSASLAANQLLLIFFHWLTYCVLFKLAGLSLKRSITVSSSIITVFLMALFEPVALSFLNDMNQSLNYSFVYRWHELLLPGNSNLGLRSALPAISGCISLVGLHFLEKRPKAKFCFLGGLIGAQPLWSNDYGIPSAIALFAVTMIHLFKGNLGKKLPQISRVLGCAALTFLLLGSVLTHGHLLQWFGEIRGVASDQFWYYEWRKFDPASMKGLQAGKILDLEDIIDYFVHPFFFIYLSALTIVTLSVLGGKESINHLLLIYIGITVFGAGTLSSLGGTFFWRYYTPTNLVGYFVVFVALNILIGQANLIPRLQRLRPSLQRYPSSPTSRVIRVIHALLMGWFLTVSVAALLLITFVHPLSSQPYENRNFFSTKELDGWLNIRFKPAYQIAERLRQQTQTLPPTQRMLSTYSSMMDVVAGSKNATGVDYIIHALGDRVRTRYLDRWKSTMPEYITTIREDFTPWETWVRRTNWWFYRNFATLYQPISASHYNIVWQRSKTDKTINSPIAECTVRRTSDHSADLIVNTQRTSLVQGTRSPNQAKDDLYLVDLALGYHLNVKNSWIPVFGRGLLNAVEIKTPSFKPVGQPGNRAYGLPPRHLDWHIPLEHRLGTSSVLRLVGYPEKRSRLVIDHCQAQVFLPLSAFAVTKELQPADVSNESWKNGISIASTQNKDRSQVGFITNDSQISTVYVGDNVMFAHSQSRKIIAIEGNKVWVSGSELDSIKDGYPNSIVIMQK